MRLKCATLFTLVAVCMLWPTWTAFAQTPAVARLLVTVVDPSGSVIRGATVVTRSLDDAASTQALKPATTSGAGLATIDGLRAGRYAIQASFPGFQMGILTDIRLRAGDNRHVIVLALQGLQNEITVLRDAQAAAADPRARFAETLTRVQIEALSDDPAEMDAQLRDMAGPTAILRIDSFEGGALPPKA